MFLRGDGFALGRPARVHLRGVVFRAGYEPARVSVSLRAHTEAQDRLRVPMPGSLQAAFCGEPGQASHATFRGDVEVSIAARAVGAPAVVGRLRGATVELYPARKSRQAEQRTAERAERAVSYLGLDLTEPLEAGLLVVAVRPGKPAAKAGVRAGDRLIEAGGVTLLQASDLGSAPSRDLRLTVVRGDRRHELTVDIDGMSPRPALSLQRAAPVLGAAALVFFALSSPLGRALGWLEMLVAARRRAQRARARPLPARPATGLAWWLAFVLVGAAVVGVGLGHSMIAGLDPATSIGALWLASCLLRCLSALISGGGRPRGMPAGVAWSLSAAVAACAAQAIGLLPAALALGAPLLESGLDLGRALGAQGAWPWQWTALRDPGLLGLSFLLCLSAAGPVAPRPSANFLAAAEEPRAARPRAAPALHIACSAGVLALSFWGGAALPAGGVSQPVFAALLGAAVVLGKYAGAAALILWLRQLTAGLGWRKWLALNLRRLIPLAALCVAFSCGGRRLAAHSGLVAWLGEGFPLAASIATAVVAALLWRRARHAASPGLLANPWL